MLTALFEQIVNGTMIGCIYVLVALGMVLIFGVMQVLNFAHGVLFMAGGYVCHFAFFKLTGSYPASIALSMLALAAVGARAGAGRVPAAARQHPDADRRLARPHPGDPERRRRAVGPQRAADAGAGRGDHRAARLR